MLVADIMTPNPVTVTLDTELHEIKEIFDNAHFHHILVEDEIDNTLVGIISDRDVLRELSPYLNTLSETFHDKETLFKRAHQFMSRGLVTVKPTTDCKKAAEKMLLAEISCLPVVGTDKKILGIVTWKDFLRLYIALR